MSSPYLGALGAVPTAGVGGERLLRLGRADDSEIGAFVNTKLRSDDALVNQQRHVKLARVVHACKERQDRRDMGVGVLDVCCRTTAVRTPFYQPPAIFQ